MKLKIIFPLFFMFFFAGCTEWIIVPAHIYSVDILETTALGQTIAFQMECQTPDPCFEFHRLEIKHSEFDVYVKVYAKRDPEIICIQILGSIKASGEFEPPQAGTYRFHFWQETLSKYLDKTVAVK